MKIRLLITGFLALLWILAFFSAIDYVEKVKTELERLKATCEEKPND